MKNHAERAFDPDRPSALPPRGAGLRAGEGRQMNNLAILSAHAKRAFGSVKIDTLMNVVSPGHTKSARMSGAQGNGGDLGQIEASVVIERIGDGGSAGQRERQRGAQSIPPEIFREARKRIAGRFKVEHDG